MDGFCLSRCYAFITCAALCVIIMKQKRSLIEKMDGKPKIILLYSTKERTGSTNYGARLMVFQREFYKVTIIYFPLCQNLIRLELT